ncbi:hypothetical protein HYS03_02050 [Candidatus Woesebacteria bacterium]|nr:hypothetical protein [Candidatus Woesebacteria bacterium]
MPYELHGLLWRKFYDAKVDKRREIWKSFNLPVEEIQKKFILMTKERNEFAKRKGYLNRVDMILDEIKISRAVFDSFMRHIDKVIGYCNRQLPGVNDLPNWFYSEFNSPCFICRMSLFPFKNFDEVIDCVMGEYKFLSEFKDKIDIQLGSESKMVYKRETDSFEITIYKDENIRHKSIDLIHELGHVICFLRDSKNNINHLKKSKYLREKEAFEIEFSVLQKISLTLFHAYFGDVLKLIWETLFQIELYDNPNRNLDKLYAEIFNRCFIRAKQKTNPLYILEKRIVLSPLSSLPHAVSQAGLVMKMV